MPIIRDQKLEPLIVHTGKFTGRSPEDRYFVKTKENENIINWNLRNQSISEKIFEDVYEGIQEYLFKKINFAFKGNVIADSNNFYAVELLTDEQWYTQFAKNIFRNDNFSNYAETIKIYHAPSFYLKQKLKEIKNSNFVILHPEKKIILIGGTGYSGEIKKSVFSLLNILLVDKNILPMHCSANYSEENGTTIYFGLSGTGKTTLSSDSSKKLIGDDEHGWTADGIFNIEGGCYAKINGLEKNKEPDIYNATQHPTSIVENVILDSNNCIDFNNISITENTRSCYALDIVKNVYQNELAPHPSSILMLTCDAFGVLPPVSKLSAEQAIFHFISGYTAKIPGTESNIKKPIATFSPCFGGPFMPRYISEYANLFRERINEFDSQCWLINTGWWGGAYGVGRRIDLNITRKILTKCISNSFDPSRFKKSNFFDLNFPTFLEDKMITSLNPLDKWKDKDMYRNVANNLNKLFQENYSKLSIS